MFPRCNSVCFVVIFSFRFVSNFPNNGMGFLLEYESSDIAPMVTYRVGEVGKCGGIFTFPIGTITSPSYPNFYPQNADCLYTISQPADRVILLNFISLNLHRDRCNDRLDIRDGPSPDSHLLTRVCGNEIPAPIQTTQNQLWMR